VEEIRVKKRAAYSLLLIATIIAAIMSVSVGAYASTEVQSITLTGKWTDSYGYTYFLIAFGGKIFGYVKVTDWWTGYVIGTYTGSSFEFTAHNPPPIEEGAAEWFTYTGRHTLTTAEGTWVNSLGSSGSFTMARGW